MPSVREKKAGRVDADVVEERLRLAAPTGGEDPGASARRGRRTGEEDARGRQVET